MDNRAYTQFEDTHVHPPSYYSTPTPANNGHVTNGHATNGQATTFNDESTAMIKKWKNSKRLCWALLIVSIGATILQIAGASVAGESAEKLLIRFISGIWLAALGIIGAVLGLMAYRNPYESSKCFSISHFVLIAISTLAYAVIIILSIDTIVLIRAYMHDMYLYLINLETEAEMTELVLATDNSTTTMAMETTTMILSSTTTGDSMDEIISFLRALKGQIAISGLTLGFAIAFVALGIIATILIFRNWWRKQQGQKTMAIVYMPQDQVVNAQMRTANKPQVIQP